MVDAENNGHDDDISIADVIENAIKDSRQEGKERHYSNSSFTAIDGKNPGVLASMLQAIKKTDDYRQELKTANWADITAAKKAVAAIHERLMCGVSIDPIIDRIIAESAGVNSARLELVIKGLTHTYFNPDAGQNQRSRWFGGKGNKEPQNNNSMLS